MFCVSLFAGRDQRGKIQKGAREISSKKVLKFRGADGDVWISEGTGSIFIVAFYAVCCYGAAWWSELPGVKLSKQDSTWLVIEDSRSKHKGSFSQQRCILKVPTHYRSRSGQGRETPRNLRSLEL